MAEQLGADKYKKFDLDKIVYAYDEEEKTLHGVKSKDSNNVMLIK